MVEMILVRQHRDITITYSTEEEEGSLTRCERSPSPQVSVGNIQAITSLTVTPAEARIVNTGVPGREGWNYKMPYNIRFNL